MNNYGAIFSRTNKLTKEDIKFGILKLLEANSDKQLATVSDVEEYMNICKTTPGAMELFYKLEKIKNTAVMYTYTSKDNPSKTLLDITYGIIKDGKFKAYAIGINKLYHKYIKPYKKNMKSTNESVAELLIEAAAELLGESTSARQKYSEKLLEKARYSNKDKYDSETRHDARSDLDRYNDTHPCADSRDFKDLTAKELKQHHYNNLNDRGKKDHIEMDRKRKERFNKEFSGDKPKNAELHDRINNRAKAKNESVACLLIEAAELLNENSSDNYNDDMLKAKEKFLKSREERSKKIKESLESLKNSPKEKEYEDAKKMLEKINNDLDDLLK